MPKPPHRQAPWPPRVSVPPSVALTPTAAHGSNRPCVEMPLEGVPEGCSGARARRERRRHWYAGRTRPLGARHAKASSPPSNVATPCEHPPISCSPTASHGRVWRCLLRACRRVAQALEHEGEGGATGKQVIGDP